jgi:NAD(P)-dependent dehydrogenase (short-subunit alcohol dehydrogenase family)
MTRLDERVALVTGASRGVGRGVALGLHEVGCTVYASGRTVADADLPPEVIRAPCDHTDAAAIGSTAGGWNLSWSPTLTTRLPESYWAVRRRW